jgi:hypothetical protein
MSISVAERRWPYTVSVPKDPDATLDYTLDWSGWLTENESLINADIEISGATLVQTQLTNRMVTAWISGGSVGRTISLRYRITTDSSPVHRVDDRTLLISVAER